MMASTDLVARSTLDLTRAPDEQWNAEMVELVGRQLFRGMSTTVGELRYCLAIADSLALNPLVGEIYFIPAKSRDGKGPSLQPYIGRNGLVKKARERGYYYESDTVHENDKFRMARKRDGTVEVTHSYGSEDRGEIVGAYAFLHDEAGRRKPAFFYAKIGEYLPEFDQDWKMRASPWGNQRSAMIEKCAMIGAGRKRLDLGNVLMDGEIASYQQQGSVGPHSEPPADAGEFDFAAITEDPELADRLRVATEGWSKAKVELVFRGRPEEEIRAHLERLESQEPIRAADHGGDGEVQRVSEAVAAQEPPIAEAVVVPDDEHRMALERRLERLSDELNDPALDDRHREELTEEYERVEAEFRALNDPGQGSLL